MRNQSRHHQFSKAAVLPRRSSRSISRDPQIDAIIGYHSRYHRWVSLPHFNRLGISPIDWVYHSRPITWVAHAHIGYHSMWACATHDMASMRYQSRSRIDAIIGYHTRYTSRVASRDISCASTRSAIDSSRYQPDPRSIRRDSEPAT